MQQMVRSKGNLERGAASDLWRNTLSQIPSVFGRMIYLSSLRSDNTAKYEHHGLSLVFGDAEADKALRNSHLQAFSEWLSSSLEEQKADLDLYLSALAGDKKQILLTWSRLAPYRNLPPASATRIERRLYVADFEALLQLLRNAYDVVFPDRDA